MVRQTTQDRINSGIKLKIYGTMFLHSKEKQIIAISTKLQKYDKRQDTTILNQKSNQQTQEVEILQQIEYNLRLQQYTNQGKRQVESCILNKQRTFQT